MTKIYSELIRSSSSSSSAYSSFMGMLNFSPSNSNPSSSSSHKSPTSSSSSHIQEHAVYVMSLVQELFEIPSSFDPSSSSSYQTPSKKRKSTRDDEEEEEEEDGGEKYWTFDGNLTNEGREMLLSGSKKISFSPFHGGKKRRMRKSEEDQDDYDVTVTIHPSLLTPYQDPLYQHIQSHEIPFLARGMVRVSEMINGRLKLPLDVNLLSIYPPTIFDFIDINLPILHPALQLYKPHPLPLPKSSTEGVILWGQWMKFFMINSFRFNLRCFSSHRFWCQILLIFAAAFVVQYFLATPTDPHTNLI